jgi:hypothetical protein
MREWLPYEAAANPRLAKAIAPIIAAWSERWFAVDGLRLGRIRPFRPGRAPPKLDEHLSVAGDFSYVAIIAGGRLSSLALDPHAGDRASTATDVRVLRQFARKMAQDLAAFVEARLNTNGAASFASDDLETYGGATFVLTDAEGGEVLGLAIPITALVSPFKSTLGAARERAPLASIEQALCPTLVRIQIDLGEACLSMSDTRALAQGDVVVLNTTLDDGASLSFAGAAKPFARGALREDGASILIDLKTGN